MYGLLLLGLNVPGLKLGAFGSRVQEISQWRAHYAEAALGRKRSAPWVLSLRDLAEIRLSLPLCPARP